MQFRLLLGIVAATTVLACASVPTVTFEDADGATDAGQPTTGNDASGAHDSGAADSRAADGGGATSDGGSAKDGSVFSAPDAAACGGSTGDICCGPQICHNCAESDCPSCTGLACTMGKVCCAKSANVTCHSPGPGC
jgi:hypothetical protein